MIHYPKNGGLDNFLRMTYICVFIKDFEEAKLLQQGNQL
jgi:hypothetical protein